MTKVLLEIFLQITDTRVELAMHYFSLSLMHQMMLLNIDMKRIRPWSCAGSPILFMNSWTLSTSCNVVNPGKTFHSNSIGSPSIVRLPEPF